MKQRCLNPRCDAFPQYGGAGITICERWLSFENFLADMGERPNGTTLDRRDGSKGYFPQNCRWADNTAQLVNQRASSRNRTGIKGVSWVATRSKWAVHIKRYGRYVLHVRVADFFEACCLVKSFEANEKASVTVNDRGLTNHTLGV